MEIHISINDDAYGVNPGSEIDASQLQRMEIIERLQENIRRLEATIQMRCWQKVYMAECNATIAIYKEQIAKLEQEVAASKKEMAARAAYETDCKKRPNYHDGSRRATWDELDSIAQWSWSRDVKASQQDEKTEVN